jgi:3-phosphoglycerate kinase
MCKQIILKLCLFSLITIFYSSNFSYAVLINSDDSLDCLAVQGLVKSREQVVKSIEVEQYESMQKKLFIKNIPDEHIAGKRVLIRVDYNVPLDVNGEISDDTRIQKSLETIKYVIEKGGKVILMSHLGRPKSNPDLEDRKRYGLEVVSHKLTELLRKEGVQNVVVKKVDDCVGEDVEKMVDELKSKEILLLENLRFYGEETYNGKTEKKLEEVLEFSKKLAKLSDIYINDAFGVSHRNNASVTKVPELLKEQGKLCAMGFLVKKEIDFFVEKLSNPAKPSVAILGGAKVSDKIKVIEHLLEKFDIIIIGGAMAYTFLAAQGYSVGDSLKEEDQYELALNILKKAKALEKEILLPIDHVVVKSSLVKGMQRSTIIFEEEVIIKNTENVEIKEGYKAFDIGPKTITLYVNKIRSAKIIVWNGPMGVCENGEFAIGTEEVAVAVKRATLYNQAVSIVGGGDSVAAVNRLNLGKFMSHVSTGGGASLELLEGKALPGMLALSDKVVLAKIQAEKAS